jgi:hypothetical protein
MRDDAHHVVHDLQRIGKDTIVHALQEKAPSAVAAVSG